MQNKIRDRDTDTPRYGRNATNSRWFTIVLVMVALVTVALVMVALATVASVAGGEPYHTERPLPAAATLLTGVNLASYF